MEKKKEEKMTAKKREDEKVNGYLQRIEFGFCSSFIIIMKWCDNSTNEMVDMVQSGV